jgi:hypothetical protein
MNWPYLKRGDVAGILLMAVLLGAILFLMLIYPNLGQKVNFGFGPEWECTHVGEGDPVCVKSHPAGDAAEPEKPISNQ